MTDGHNLTVLRNTWSDDLLTKLRDTRTASSDFRRGADKLAQMVLCEAVNNIVLTDVEIETPVSKCTQPVLLQDKPCLLVAVLGAGTAFISGFNELDLPGGGIGYVAARRDHETHEATLSYSRLPEDLSRYKIFVGEPMLATGGSARGVIGLLKGLGADDITLCCIIAAERGVMEMQTSHPDVTIVTAGLDKHLTSNAYIDPGLGDFGDRYLGVTPA